MKDIKNYITESNNGWQFDRGSIKQSSISLDELNDSAVKWIRINTESEVILPVTNNDIKLWAEDEENDTLEVEVFKLKIGESYNADGGTNIYIRIK